MAMRELTPAARRLGLFLGSARCHRSIASGGRGLAVAAADAHAGKAKAVEKIWREFFSDPSQWWDYRLEKVNARYPDFKHKASEGALWIDGKSNPTWVEAELSAMAPGAIQSDIFTWNKRLAKQVADGNYEKTVELFHQMQREGPTPDKSICLRVLKACAGLQSLKEGEHVHKQLIQIGCETDLYVGSSLVDMYAKCGSIGDARMVFNKMATRNVVSWNAMIHGYVENGQGHKALILYHQMQLEDVEPDHVTFIGVLQACASVGELEEGRRVHRQIIQRRCDLDLFVCNSLIDMYAKCDCPEDAQIVFSKMPAHTVVSWNAMIQGYVKCGRGFKALELFRKMQEKGVEPDPVTFLGVLNACASVGALDEGRAVHEKIINSNLEADSFLSSSLIDMYAKCRCLEDARMVFDKMAVRNVVPWNTMILGYVKCGHGQKALDLSQQMQKDGVRPDPVTFAGLLGACAIVPALEDGRHVHEQIIQSGPELEVLMGSSLVDMYAKCGSIEDARRVFDKMPVRPVSTWNAMILGYVKCGHGRKALDLSSQMQQDGVELDPVTFVGMLNACACVGLIEEGKHVHKQIVKNGFDRDIFVGNSLIDMYARCGSMADARKVFSKMCTRNVVSWNAMILGYAERGQGQKALELSHQMHKEGMKPDPVTFVGMLNACASKGELEEGRLVHEQMIQSGFESEVFVGSSLVDMYAKCGSIEDARGVFDKMPVRSVAAWNAMIFGYTKYGEGHKAREVFQQMQREGVNPDPVTFVGLLDACARTRALEEGRLVHEKILHMGYKSDVYVSNALIDMYATCGSIEDARKTFNNMPIRNVYSWNAMILAYARCGLEKNALDLSERMQQGDPASFLGEPFACPSVAALEEGRLVHEQTIQSGWE